jgi:hypothetical protein
MAPCSVIGVRLREESQWGAVAHMRRVSDGSGCESDSVRGRVRQGEIIESLFLSQTEPSLSASDLSLRTLDGRRRIDRSLGDHDYYFLLS